MPGIVQNRAVFASNMSELVTSDTLDGKEYYVLPTILCREGVMNGLLYRAKELAKLAVTWNGKPVTIYHPTVNGTPVSASSKDVIENSQVGLLLNVHWDAELNALKGSAYIEKDKLPKVSTLTLELLNNNQNIDVSTGLFHDTLDESGEFNGKAYYGIAINYVPDHLAVLPDQKGACSWEDGAGLPRLNEDKENKKGILDTLMDKVDTIVDYLTINVLGTARTPSYIGTEIISWAEVNKSVSSYVDGYFKSTGKVKPDDFPSSVEEMPSSVKRWVASKTLLGDPNADNSRDLVFFPVVNPSTNKLNAGALRAILGGRGAAANIPNSAKESAQNKARSLLESKFGKENEMARNELVEKLTANAELSTEELSQLDGIDESVLAKLMVNEEKQEKEPTMNEEVRKEEKEVTIADLPTDVQLKINEAFAVVEDKKNSLISKIQEKNPDLFTNEELQAKSIAELNKLVSLATNKADEKDEEKEPTVNASDFSGVNVGSSAPKKPKIMPLGV